MTPEECEAEIARITAEEREMEARYSAERDELFGRRLRALHARDLAVTREKLAKMPPDVIDALLEPKPRWWHVEICRPFRLMSVFPLRVEWSPDGRLARAVLLSKDKETT